MPNRILRDGILTSRAVNALGESAEVLYRRLISVVDDYGRFELDLDILRARLFPLQLEAWPTERVGKVLLECRELLALYEVSGRIYLEVNNFKQQTRTKSKCPDITCGHLLANDINCDHLRTKSYPYSYSKSYSETEAEASAITPRAPTPIRLPSPDFQPRIEVLYAAHPMPGFKQDGTVRVLSFLSDSVHPENAMAGIERSHAAWCKFWADNPAEYVPGFGKFFDDGYYLRQPKAREPTSVGFKSKAELLAERQRKAVDEALRSHDC